MNISFPNLIHRRFYLPFVVLVLALAGCGSDSATGSGTVTYKGQPLTQGNVIFRPEPGRDSPQAVGVIGVKGEFTLSTGNGEPIKPGKYVVLVICRENLPPITTGMPAIPKSLIDDRYENELTTPLRVELKRGENNCPLNLE